MNITLISPYSDNYGLRILSSCLKKEGHDIQQIFLPIKFIEDYQENILDKVAVLAKGSALIGISLTTNHFRNTVQLTRKLKSRLDVPVVWGGIHPTIRPEESLEHADLICLGEGEIAFVELVRRLAHHEDYRSIPSIYGKDNGEVFRNPLQTLIQDLDGIPFPDYSFQENYILDEGHIKPLDPKTLRKHIGNSYMILATRGCMFACTYCVNNTLKKMFHHQKTLRKRGIDNIIEELLMARQQLYAFDIVRFEDDTFLSYSTAEIRDFSRKYKEKIGLKLNIGGVTPTILTEEKLALLVDAGLESVRMGIQSASEHTKKLFKRNYANQNILNAANIFTKFKDKLGRIRYDIILDNPFETDNEVIETLLFVAQLPTPYMLTLFALTLYPETELYYRARQEGLITDDHKDVYNKNIHGYKRTQLNRLFEILSRYAKRDMKLPYSLIRLMTRKNMLRLKVTYLIYYILLGLYPLAKTLKRARLKLKKST